MNDPMPIGARMAMEMFEDDDDAEDNLTISLSLPSQVDFVVMPRPGRLGIIVGQAKIVEQVEIFEAHGSVEQPVPSPEEPKDLLWTPIARMLMSPTRYRAEWLPHIADMNFERSECLKRRDKRGARWAVLRAHYYSVPRRLWAIPGIFLLWLLRHWIPF